MAFDPEQYLSKYESAGPAQPQSAAPPKGFDPQAYLDKYEPPPNEKANEPDDRGGLVGEAARYVIKRHPVAALGASLLGAFRKNVTEPIQGYVLGTKVDEQTKQERPLTGDEFLEQGGWAKGPSATIPAKTLLGRDIEVSPRGAVGQAVEMATDPLSYLIMGEKPAAAAAEKAAPAAEQIAKKSAKIIASVPEETTNRYISSAAERQAIKNAPSSTDISNRLTALAKETSENLESAKSAHVAAKQSLKDAESAASMAESKAGEQFANERFAAKEALSGAKEKYDLAAQQLKEAVKDHHLGALTGDTVKAVGELKKKVSEASGAGYDILAKEKGGIDAAPLVESLQKHHDAQFINGVEKSAQAAATANEIQSWQNRLGKMTKESGGQLSFPQAKEMMQELDKITEYSPEAGGFSDKTNQALKDLRRDINESVREKSKAYAAHMDENVAPLTKLLGKANELYGTPERAVSNLNNLVSPKGEMINLPILQSLSDATGKELRGSVEHYLNAKNIQRHGTKFDELMASTPQATELQKRQAVMQDLMHPEALRKRQTVARAMAAPDIVAAETKIESSKAALEEAERKQGLLKGITPDSVTKKQWALKNPSGQYGAEKRFGAIDKEFGTKFESEIRARNDADFFRREVTQGSRMVNLGRAIGGGIGGAIGQSIEGAAAGGAIGGVAGGAMDKYAGHVAQWMLDRGIESSASIKTLAKEIKGTSFAPQMIASIAASGVMSDKSKGADKWASDGFVNLMKHADANDKKTLAVSAEMLMKDAKMKDLLVQASSAKPGSKAMQAILEKIKERK